MRYTRFTNNPRVTLPRHLAGVRGWQVRSGRDEKLGTVEDVLLDEHHEPRYLNVYSGGLFTSRNVLVPLHTVQLDDTYGEVILPGMIKEGFHTLPDFSGELSSITQEYEANLESAYWAASGPPPRAATPASSDISDQPRRS
jgi:hypothetical protein